MSIHKRRDLSSQIEEKEVEIAKLQKREKAVMQECGKTDHAGMQELQKQIAVHQATIRHTDNRKPDIQESIAKSKRSYLNLHKGTEEYDSEMLEKERLAVRSETESIVQTEIEAKTGFPLQQIMYEESKKETQNALEGAERQEKHTKEHKKSRKKTQIKKQATR